MLQRAFPSIGEQLPMIGLRSWLQFDVGSSASAHDSLKEVVKDKEEDTSDNV